MVVDFSSNHVIPDKKINGHPVEFIVRPEDRAVVAQIRMCSSDVLKTFESKSGITTDLFFGREAYKFAMQTYMKSVAKCHPDDEFNEEVGKKLAYKKLRQKYWRKYHAKMGKFVSHLRAVCVELENDCERAELKTCYDPVSATFGGVQR